MKNEHSPHLPAYEDGKDSVLKRPHIKFRRRGITQKKAYNKKNKNNNLYETNIKDSPPHFYEIQEEYKVLLFETNSQIKNNRDLYRGTNELQKGYQPRTNIVKVKQGDLVTNSHSTWARWRNHFSQLLNVHVVNDIRQTEIHTAEPLVPEPNAFVVEMATEKLKDTNHLVLIKFPADLIKAGGRTFVPRSNNLLILFGIRTN